MAVARMQTVGFLVALLLIASSCNEATQYGPVVQAPLVIDPVKGSTALRSIDADVRHALLFKNVSGSVLTISKVSSTCKCTTAEFSKVVQPGEVGSVVANIDLRGRPVGTHRFRFTLSCEAEGRSSPTLEELVLSVDYRPPTRSDPEKVDLHWISGTGAYTHFRVMDSSVNADVDIESIASSDEAVQARVVRRHLEAGLGWLFDCELRAGGDKAPAVRSELSVSLKNGDVKRLTIPVHTNVLARVYAVPNVAFVTARGDADGMHSKATVTLVDRQGSSEIAFGPIISAEVRLVHDNSDVSGGSHCRSGDRIDIVLADGASLPTEVAIPIIRPVSDTLRIRLCNPQTFTD
jgi:hypothetical protein